jgi:hypothetical protein
MPTIANPAQHVLSNAGYANSAEQFIEVMREQHKEGRFRLRQDLPDRHRSHDRGTVSRGPLSL